MGSTVGVGGTIGGKLLPADMGRRGRMRQKCLERPLSLPGREGCRHEPLLCTGTEGSQPRASSLSRARAFPAAKSSVEPLKHLPA